MVELEINFIIENEIKKIKCNKNEFIQNKIENLIQSSYLNHEKIDLYYQGKKLKQKTKANHFIKNKKKLITILVVVNRIKKYIVCQKCKCCCLMKFDDYRIDTQCQKGHFLPDLSLEELNNYFERTQVNFYNCIKHSMQFSSFCINCQENICELCEKENHNTHKVEYFDNFFESSDYEEEIQKSKNKLEEFGAIINKLKVNAENIISKIKHVQNTIEKLYTIYKEIYNSYFYGLNSYYILKNISDNIDFHVQFDEINEIINQKDDIRKLELILKLYDKINEQNHIIIEYKKEEEKNISTSIKEEGILNIQSVKAFGQYFVNNNKNLCRVIIDDVENELKEEYFFVEKNPKIILKNIKKITDMSYIFHNCIKLFNVYDIDKWNTSKVTNMSNLFYNCESLKELPDISKWDTSNVKDMSYMFTGCKVIKLPDISKWDISSVTNMRNMFSNCSKIRSLPDISNWNTSSVIDLSHIFENCESLETLPEIGKWETSSLVDMSYVFKNCFSLTNALDNIIKWKFPKVTNMSGIFYNCKKLSPKNGINWKLPEIIDKKSIIEGCPTELIEKIMGIKYNASVNDKNCFIY